MGVKTICTLRAVGRVSDHTAVPGPMTAPASNYDLRGSYSLVGFNMCPQVPEGSARPSSPPAKERWRKTTQMSGPHLSRAALVHLKRRLQTWRTSVLSDFPLTPDS